MALQIKDNLAYLKKNTLPASGKEDLKLFAQVLSQISIESGLSILPDMPLTGQGKQMAK